MGNVIVGLLIAGLGVALMYYSHTLVDLFGRFPRAEAKLGGTRKMYVLAGFAMIVLGFLFVFGLVSVEDVKQGEDSGFGGGVESTESVQTTETNTIQVVEN